MGNDWKNLFVAVFFIVLAAACAFSYYLVYRG